MALDPMTMARFLVLPGAEELVDAFSRIPPGKLRQTVVAHAQALAEAHDDAPAHMRMQDPLLSAAATPRGVALALSGPRRGEVPIDTWETRAVQLRMGGTPPVKIAAELGEPIKGVLAALKTAKRHGIKYPPIRMTQVVSAKVAERPVFAITMGEYERAPAKLRGVLEHGAGVLGVPLARYIELRGRAVALFKQMRGNEDVAAELRLPLVTIKSWRGRARVAGLIEPMERKAAA